MSKEATGVTLAVTEQEAGLEAQPAAVEVVTVKAPEFAPQSTSTAFVP